MRRYLSQDPIGLEVDLNLYAYAHGNPIARVDPLGQKPGDKFASPDDAAIDAGNYARSFPMQRVEYGGWITKVGKC